MVSLLVKEGNSCVMYNLIVSLFLYLGLVSELSSPGMIVPAIEKIILLANVGNSNLKETASLNEEVCYFIYYGLFRYWF